VGEVAWFRNYLAPRVVALEQLARMIGVPDHPGPHAEVADGVLEIVDELSLEVLEFGCQGTMIRCISTSGWDGWRESS
jgi:hypothetical protein